MNPLLLSARNPIPRRPIPDRVPVAALLMQIEIRPIADWIAVVLENQQWSHVGVTHESFAQGFDTVTGVHAISYVAGAVEDRRDGEKRALFGFPRDGGGGGTVVSGEQPGILADGIEAVQLVEDIREGGDAAAERGSQAPK